MAIDLYRMTTLLQGIEGISLKYSKQLGRNLSKDLKIIGFVLN